MRNDIRLKIEIQDTDKATLLVLEGELTLRTAPDLQSQIQVCYKRKEPKGMIIDLESVKYIDSSGIATLVEILKNCVHQKKSLALCSLSQTVFNVFEVANLDSIFDVHTDRQSALTHLGGMTG